MGFAAFALIAVSVLLGTHALVWLTTVRFMDVGDGRARAAIAVVLAVLAFSFPVTAVIARTTSSRVADVLAVLASAWIGLLVHLLIASVAIWAVYGVTRIAGLRWDTAIMYVAAYGAAFALTGYGVVNSLRPRVTRIEVEIRGLPDAWKGKTVVHL